LIYQFKILILTAICVDVLGTRKCQNFKFLTKSRFTTNRTCYTLLNFRKNPTGGVSIEMAEPIAAKIMLFNLPVNNLSYRIEFWLFVDNRLLKINLLADG
jgi:hypothetical protein